MVNYSTNPLSEHSINPYLAHSTNPLSPHSINPLLPLLPPNPNPLIAIDPDPSDSDTDPDIFPLFPSDTLDIYPTNTTTSGSTTGRRSSTLSWEWRHDAKRNRKAREAARIIIGGCYARRSGKESLKGKKGEEMTWMKREEMAWKKREEKLGRKFSETFSGRSQKSGR